MSHPSAWQLKLYGDFCLTDPTGQVIRLSDRKVEGLLAILAVQRDYGIDRAEVAEILWPEKGLDNLVNLRQALSVLRRTLGEEAIEATRKHCRLSSGFTIRSDHDKGATRRGAFMPGHEGKWFQANRYEAEDVRRSVVSSFYETLQWFAIHDRAGMHSLLKARASLTRGLVYTDLLKLLHAAPEDEGCIGWSLYWQGASEDDLETSAGLLRQALREAKRTGDVALASDVCLELGKVYARTGKLEKALRLCDIAESLALGSPNRSLTANALRLRGTVLIHWQDQNIGLDLLRQTEEFIDDPIEQAVFKSTRASYEASAHQPDRAAKTLDAAMRFSRQIGHVRFDVTSSLTHVMLTLANGSRAAAITELETLVERYGALGATQFGVYAGELLAKLYFLEGQRGLANERLGSARRSRRESQMVVTRLEAFRVDQIA